jgi:flagellar protein FlgJ
MGIFNCRNVRGGSTLSLHAEGRAIDIAPYSRSQGTAISRYLLSRASELNVQEIIYYRQIWSARYPNAGWRNYTGSNPHTDHVHIGLNWLGAGSMNLTTEDTGMSLLQLLLLAGLGYGIYYVATEW